MEDTDGSNLQAQACDRCWKRKQKCDRKSPQCDNCEKTGVKCIARVRGRALDSPSNGLNPEIPQGSFVSYMTKRVAFLESQLNTTIEASPSVSRSPAMASNHSVGRHQQAGSGSPAAQSIDNAVNEVQYLSLSAMSGPDRQDQVLWESPNFATFTKEASKLSGVDPSLATAKVNIDSDTSLTLRDLEDRLRIMNANSLEYYVKVYCLFSTVDFPCVSQQDCIQALQTVLQAESEGSFSALLQSLPEEITLSVIAVAIGTFLFLERRARDSIQATCVRMSRYLLPVLAAQDSDNVTVQVLTMQAILSLYDPSAGPTWYLVGLAMTKAISIGLHSQQASLDDKDPDETISQPPRSLFWTLYTLDRTIAFAMDRPLSIEDTDITLEMPDATMQTLSNSREAALTSLHICTVRHAELLSRWHRDSGNDLHNQLSSYQYWRSMCKEILDRAHLRISNHDHRPGAQDIDDALLAYLQKHETQLACRALVQVCVIGCRNGFSVQTHAVCKKLVGLEVPQFLSNLKNCIEHRQLSPTFLDAYDTFAAAIILVYFQQQFPGQQYLSNTEMETIAFGIGVSGMRMIMTAMDIVQKVSELFPPVRGLKEVLWTFLSALEKCNITLKSGALLTDDAASPLNGAIRTLEAEIQRCPIRVPNHLQGLMRSSLHAASYHVR